MEILLDKTYNNLINEIKDLKRRNEELVQFDISNTQTIKDLKQQYELLNKEFGNYIADSKMNFRIKRFIVGKKGSGKTTLIKSLLPRLKNYMVFDFCNEYKELPADKRFVVGDALDLEHIVDGINANKDKLIILDGIDFTGNIHWIMNMSRDLDFIIVSQTKWRVEPFLEEVDFVYDFGCGDEWLKEPDNNKIAILSIPKEKTPQKDDSIKRGTGKTVKNKSLRNSLSALGGILTAMIILKTLFGND